MDYSVLYGLRNPAFTDDYAMSMFEKQFPTNINPSNGFLDPLTSKINPGQPGSDVFQSKQQKEYSLIKKALVVLGLAGVALLGIKIVPKYIKSAASKVMNSVKSGFSKISDSFKNIFHKIKK